METAEKAYPKWSAQVAVRALLHFNVRDVVISPGTRDMPLIIACDAEQELRKHVVIDERSAAFVALGMAGASRSPVALVCTSGSALLNYAPALAEAYYRHLPLIVLSADRPERWIDQADSQTIRQPGALAAVVRKSAVIPDCNPGDAEALRLASLRIFDAIACAMRVPYGPVHLNFPFGLPLGAEYPVLPKFPFPTLLKPQVNMVDYHIIRALASEWAGKKILVVCGQMAPDNDTNRIFNRLASQPDIAVIAENISNLHSDRIPMNIDAMLTEMKANDIYLPDLAIVCGGALVSAKLKGYLRSLGDVPLWYVGPYADMIKDTFDNLAIYIDSEPGRFLSDFSFRMGKYLKKTKKERSIAERSYSERWSLLSRAAGRSHSDYAEAAPWSELKAINLILGELPGKYNLHISNGTAIRYALLSDARFHSVSCNRGVSGIEGSTSTAVGAAIKHPSPTLLITGDMSFSYDIGALAIKEIPRNFKIIVLSNAGGGIFRFITKTNKLLQREQYFCAEPKLPLPQLAEAYGFRYLKAASMPELKESLSELKKTDDVPVILDVIVDPDVSARTFSEYFQTSTPHHISEP